MSAIVVEMLYVRTLATVRPKAKSLVPSSIAICAMAVVPPLSFAAYATPAFGALSNPQARARLDGMFRELTRQELFCGVVLVGKRDVVLFAGAYGPASRELKFLNGFASDKLVSAAMRTIMTTSKPAAPQWGYGMSLDGTAVGHTGGFPGIGAIVLMYPEGYRLIVLSNIDGGAGVAFHHLLDLLSTNDQSSPEPQDTP